MTVSRNELILRATGRGDEGMPGRRRRRPQRRSGAGAAYRSPAGCARGTDPDGVGRGAQQHPTAHRTSPVGQHAALEARINELANAVRDEQAKVLHAISPIPPEEVLTRAVRGQYGPGDDDDEHMLGYRQETGVNPNSTTETFVALKLMIDNWRWAGVPFYLRTGKRLPKRVTEIAIQFKSAPLMLFRDTPVERLRTNRLVIHIQPDEGISLRFGAKIPGPIMRLGAVEMDFNYVDYFGSVPSTGYERLLYDCMVGDATLFQRADMVEAGWRVIEPVLDVWKALPPRSFPNYAAGTWGPKEAEELLARDGREWRPID